MRITSGPLAVVCSNTHGLTPGLLTRSKDIKVHIAGRTFSGHLYRRFHGTVISASTGMDNRPKTTGFDRVDSRVGSTMSCVINCHRSSVDEPGPSDVVGLSGNKIVGVVHRWVGRRGLDLLRHYVG